MVAKLKWDRCFLQLFGYGDHGDIADIESAIFFGNVEIPKTGGFRFLLQAFHDFDIATNLRIAAQLRAAFPPAAFKNIRRVQKLRLQRNQFVANEFLDFFAQALFSTRKTKVHNMQSGFRSPLSHLAPTKKELHEHLTSHSRLWYRFCGKRRSSYEDSQGMVDPRLQRNTA